MFAGPLANFLLSIAIFSVIFFNTPDPQTTAVIKNINPLISTNSVNEFIAPGDEIVAIESSPISDPKDINLELLSFAGHTGKINLTLKRDGIKEYLNVAILVTDFLPTSESQSNPLNALGIEVEYKMKPIIGSVINSRPADQAGLMENDLILKINNTKINYANDISSALTTLGDQTVLFDIYRNNKLLQIPVKVESSIDENGNEIGLIGVAFGTNRSIFQSFAKGLYETYNLSLKTIQFIGKMITGNMGTENLSGPIGIAQMAGNTAQAGFIPFMYLMALLSISLGVLNLLPIPVLDGGQLTLLGLEAIRGKPLSEKTENFIYTGGILIVGALMIFAVFNDVARFF